MKKIILASDHAGYELKEVLKKHAKEQGYETIDLGPNNGEHKENYALQGEKLGHYVMKNEDSIGVAVCGTGIGISIAANKVKGIVAARITSEEDAYFAKRHNDANVIAFGGRQLEPDKANKMFDAFMKEDFEGGRHLDRVKLLK